MAVAALLAFAQLAAADAFTIPQWSLNVQVEDSSTGEYQGRFFGEVLNPFQDRHDVAVGVSTAEASYNMAWGPLSGALLIAGAQQAEDITSQPFLESRSSGFIWVEPSVDLTLDLSGIYTYSLPGGMLLTEFQIGVFDETTSETLFFDNQSDDSFSGYPASGTFMIDGQATLPAGHTLFMTYLMSVSSSGGGSGQLGIGSGSVSFNLQPIPEPATAWLLALGLLCLRKRTRRHRSRPPLPFSHRTSQPLPSHPAADLASTAAPQETRHNPAGQQQPRRLA